MLGALMSLRRAMACREAPDMSRCILCRLLAFSKLLLRAGLREAKMLWFSCPGDAESLDPEGVEFPAQGEAAFKARFVGLLGEVRFRVADFEEEPEEFSFADDFAERKESLTLGRKGVARGDCESTDCVVGALFCELKAPNC